LDEKQHFFDVCEQIAQLHRRLQRDTYRRAAARVGQRVAADG
jgi:hypothetical protein